MTDLVDRLRQPLLGNLGHVEPPPVQLEAAAEIERLNKLADAISRDCNATALERNDLRAEVEALRAERKKFMREVMEDALKRQQDIIDAAREGGK